MHTVSVNLPSHGLVWFSHWFSSFFLSSRCSLIWYAVCIIVTGVLGFLFPFVELFVCVLMFLRFAHHSLFQGFVEWMIIV